MAGVVYRLGEDLAAVSIADISQYTLSSVYVFFEPRYRRRSLGTYSALWEIDYCRRSGIPYYYLGFCVAGCAKMSYKSKFQPCQMLDASCSWVPWSEQRT